MLCFVGICFLLLSFKFFERLQLELIAKSFFLKLKFQLFGLLDHSLIIEEYVFAADNDLVLRPEELLSILDWGASIDGLYFGLVLTLAPWLVFSATHGHRRGV